MCLKSVIVPTPLSFTGTYLEYRYCILDWSKPIIPVKRIYRFSVTRSLLKVARPLAMGKYIFCVLMYTWIMWVGNRDGTRLALVSEDWSRICKRVGSVVERY